MGGATLVRELTPARAGRVPFALATQADEVEIRRLLRGNPMPGRIALTFEREPDYFADADLPGTDKQTVIASENNRVVCAGSCAIRERFINGAPRRVGYLGGLRLDARATGRFDILRRGYEFFRELQSGAPADYYFTSIAADNAPARKFLERGMPRMPAYEFVGEFVTALLPAGGQSPNSAASESGTPESNELLDCLNNHGRHYQFAECWSSQELAALSKLGLQMEDFYCVRAGGRITASAALWDQRAFKQTVIRGYAPWLAMARPAVNVAARILGTPRLPPAGSTLAHAFVSHLAVDREESGPLVALIVRLRKIAARRGIEFLTLGFAANDSRLGTLRRNFRCREYRSRIYVVRWPGLGGSAQELGGRCLGPEVALL
jgi:hypothetical protein